MRRCGGLGCSPRFLAFVQDLHAQQIRWMSRAQPFVIQIPVPLKEQMKREKKIERRKKEALRTQQSRMGDLNVPIISCKRKEFNHYRGQTYSKFAEVPLASKGWTHRKAAGDYFTINSYGGNPAFEQLENNSEKDFDSLGLDEDLVKQLQEFGFDMPTNIQTLAIPEVLEGRNTLITAETGNGKTLAFITPMLQQIKNRKRRLKSELPMNSPLGLVIVPGRELAEQIHGVASQIGRSLGIKVKLLVGGNTKKRMLTPPMSHLDLLVATFGALSKLTTTGVYNMDYLTHITLDEVDTLLDDSFSEHVTRFISKYPVKGVTEDQQPTNMSGVQLTLVAATLPLNLSTILQPIVELDSLVRISTQHLNRFMSHLPQRFFRVNHRTKVEKLMELVKKDAKRGHSVVIFSNQSKTCDWVSMFLNENSVPCINLHGAMYASIRKDKFKTFQTGKVIALSCTDLASRGLDTIGVHHVINYEFPKFISDYIHRCGRAGRVGSPTASLVTNLVHRPQEIELVQKIEYAVRKGEEFHNVNANIKRIITERAARAERNMLNLEQLQNVL